jgi:hypothetical protein
MVSSAVEELEAQAHLVAVAGLVVPALMVEALTSAEQWPPVRSPAALK